MTAPSPPDYTIEEFYASRHPVRRFVAALVATTLVLLLVWWTGLVSPRLSSDASTGHYDAASGTGVLQLDLRNESPTPVRIEAVEVMATAAITAASVDGTPVESAPEIPGTSTAQVRIEYQADRCIADRHAGATGIRLDVRTILGITNTEHLYTPFPGTGRTAIPC